MLSVCDWTVKLWWFERCICVICRILFALKLEIDYTISKHDMETKSSLYFWVQWSLLSQRHDDADPRITLHRNCHIIYQLSLYKCHHDIMSPYHHVTKSWSHHLWHWISVQLCRSKESADTWYLLSILLHHIIACSGSGCGTLTIFCLNLELLAEEMSS